MKRKIPQFYRCAASKARAFFVGSIWFGSRAISAHCCPSVLVLLFAGNYRAASRVLSWGLSAFGRSHTYFRHMLLGLRHGAQAVQVCSCTCMNRRTSRATVPVLVSAPLGRFTLSFPPAAVTLSGRELATCHALRAHKTLTSH